MATLQKVAMLVTRPGPDGLELLVFEHVEVPSGVQVPAGTVEPGEDVRAAAIRELREETGIVVDDVELLWTYDEIAALDAIVAEDVPLRTAPDRDADVVEAQIWRLGVGVHEITGGWARVAHHEYDLSVEPWRILSTVEGWLPATALARSQVRNVFHVRAPEHLDEAWDVPFAEEAHTFRCRWVPLGAARLISHQQTWIDRARPLLEAREA